jgi:hypothetical protein
VIWRVFSGVAVDERRFHLVADTIKVAIGSSGNSYTEFMRPLADHFGWSRATLLSIYNILIIIRGTFTIGTLLTCLTGMVKSEERSV